MPKKKHEKRYVVIYNYTGSRETFVGTKDAVLRVLETDIEMNELREPDDVRVFEIGAEIALNFEKVLSVVWPKEK